MAGAAWFSRMNWRTTSRTACLLGSFCASTSRVTAGGMAWDSVARGIAAEETRCASSSSDNRHSANRCSTRSSAVAHSSRSQGEPSGLRTENSICESSVDLPAPGPPLKRKLPPSVSPPPRTRSSGSIPVMFLGSLTSFTSVSGMKSVSLSDPVSAATLSAVVTCGDAESRSGSLWREAGSPVVGSAWPGGLGVSRAWSGVRVGVDFLGGPLFIQSPHWGHRADHRSDAYPQGSQWYRYGEIAGLIGSLRGKVSRTMA